MLYTYGTIGLDDQQDVRLSHRPHLITATALQAAPRNDYVLAGPSTSILPSVAALSFVSFSSPYS